MFNRWFVPMIFLVAGCDYTSTGSSKASTSSASSASSSSSTQASSERACKSLDVEQVSEYNNAVKYQQDHGQARDDPEWKNYVSGGPYDASFASCVKRRWTFENCARNYAGDMAGACAEAVKKECCP